MGFLAISEIIPPAAVLPYAGASAPEGWLICDGRAVNRTTYAALFAAIGTSHGSGDGSTTFNLPDYRWAFLRGCGPNISVTGSGTAASNQATFTAHGFNRTGVRVRLSSGTLSGLAGSTNYWVIVVDANTLAFATSKANARSNTRVGISGTNSAIIVQWEDPDASSRTANTVGGNSATDVGSAQVEATAANGLTPFHYTQGSGFAGGSAGSAQMIRSNFNDTYTSTSISSNDKETRPANVSINYIIKI